MNLLCGAIRRDAQQEETNSLITQKDAILQKSPSIRSARATRTGILAATLIASVLTACSPATVIPTGSWQNYQLARGDACFTEGSPMFSPGVGRATRMVVQAGKGWCSTRLHHRPVDQASTALRQPFWGANVVTAPSYGQIELFIEDSKTVILYRPNPGYHGPDRFVLQLAPGAGLYPVDITVTPTGIRAPRPGAIVYFDRGSYALTADAKHALDDIGRALQQDLSRIGHIILEGHADAVGTDDSNLRLSRNRNTAVKEYLVRNFGLPAEMFLLSAYGESMPADPAMPEGAINRRVRVLVSSRQ